MKTEYDPVGWAEIRADVYGGESCDEHIPYWEFMVAGDRDSDKSSTPLIIDVKAFPVGTKVTVEVPVCPKCGMTRDDCELAQKYHSNECKFDWHQWEIDEYA